MRLCHFLFTSRGKCFNPQGHISVLDVLTGRRVKTVLLGDDDTSVIVRYVNVCHNTTVVCDYGKELKIVTFPAVMDKAE